MYVIQESLNRIRRDSRNKRCGCSCTVNRADCTSTAESWSSDAGSKHERPKHGGAAWHDVPADDADDAALQRNDGQDGQDANPGERNNLNIMFNRSVLQRAGRAHLRKPRCARRSFTGGRELSQNEGLR